jgi:secreted Zn-dependent insulinase-like peptidase
LLHQLLSSGLTLLTKLTLMSRPLSRLQTLLNYRRWRVDQYQQIITSLTPERLSDFLGRLFDRLFLEALVVGNIPEAEAASIVQRAHAKMREAWKTADVWPG